MSSKYKRQGKGRFVQLHEWMMRSAAWQNLDPTGRAIYVEVKRRYDGFNNGRIGLSCRDAGEAIGMSKSSAARAFDRLIELGFLRIGKPSGFNVKNRMSMEWALTEYKDDATGELATKDFMKWTSPQSDQGDCQKNTRSQNEPSQSHQRDRSHRITPLNGSHGPTHGTVRPDVDISQSHQRDTYRSTIGG